MRRLERAETIDALPTGQAGAPKLKQRSEPDSEVGFPMKIY